jgi:hypothetical protein
VDDGQQDRWAYICNEARKLNVGIFSRRDVQAALDSLSPCLAGKQLEELVGKLNGGVCAPRPGREAVSRAHRGDLVHALAAEWEVIVLAALSRCGSLKHQKDLGGPSRLDVLFQRGEPDGLEFVADIRVVSDADAHRKNPSAEFCEAIRLFLQRLGHSSAGLDLRIENVHDGEYEDRKIRLTLPPKDELDAFVKRELGQFLANVAREPAKDASVSYDREGIKFTLGYNSNERRFGSVRHLSYTAPQSLHRNPLANSLAKKGKQLGRSGYSGAKGTIICDGGCDSLRDNGTIGCKRIVGEVFRARSSTLWVLVIRFDESVRPLGLHQISLRSKLYWNEHREKSIFADTAALLERMVAHLPTPETTPANAHRPVGGNKQHWGRQLGGCRMGDKTIRMSARTVSELFAGKITMDQFIQSQGLDPTIFFTRHLRNGNTLKNASVERNEHSDDDWIVLEYDGPDPAISPYRVPRQ